MDPLRPGCRQLVQIIINGGWTSVCNLKISPRVRYLTDRKKVLRCDRQSDLQRMD